MDEAEAIPLDAVLMTRPIISTRSKPPGRSLKLAHTSYDVSSITLDLTLDLPMNEPYPAHDFTLAHALGLFR